MLSLCCRRCRCDSAPGSGSAAAVFRHLGVAVLQRGREAEAELAHDGLRQPAVGLQHIRQAAADAKLQHQPVASRAFIPADLSV